MRCPLAQMLQLCLVAAPAAQLSGTYTVDPAGTGARNFESLLAASFELFVQGVTGPVVFDVAPGSYAETLYLLPTVGSSRTNTVTFRSPVAGAASLSNVTFDAQGSVFPGWVVLDGFRCGAVTVRGGDHVIRNCTFTSRLMVEGSGTEVHGCVFAAVSSADDGCRCLVQVLTVGGSFHDNQVLVSDGRELASFRPPPVRDARLRVYNNIFKGALGGQNALTLSGPVDFVHNTVVDIPSSNSVTRATIRLLTRFAMFPRVIDNIVVREDDGLLVDLEGEVSPYHVEMDENLYFGTAGSVGLFRSDDGSWSQLTFWQRRTGLDPSSAFADPQFVDVASSPHGLMLIDGSPAVRMATRTPAYAAIDFGGVTRENPGTVGAYEGRPAPTFVGFGTGCSGTGFHVPIIDHAGALRYGSTDFAVLLRSAYGGPPAQAACVIGIGKTRIPLGGVCSLLVTPNLIVPAAVSGTGPAGGTASVQIDLPSTPSSRGSEAHFQWAVIDPGAPIGFAVSGGATLTL